MSRDVLIATVTTIIFVASIGGALWYGGYTDTIAKLTSLEELLPATPGNATASTEGSAAAPPPSANTPSGSDAAALPAASAKDENVPADSDGTTTASDSTPSKAATKPADSAAPKETADKGNDLFNDLALPALTESEPQKESVLKQKESPAPSDQPASHSDGSPSVEAPTRSELPTALEKEAPLPEVSTPAKEQESSLDLAMPSLDAPAPPAAKAKEDLPLPAAASSVPDVSSKEQLLEAKQLAPEPFVPPAPPTILAVMPPVNEPAVSAPPTPAERISTPPIDELPGASSVEASPAARTIPAPPTMAPALDDPAGFPSVPATSTDQVRADLPNDSPRPESEPTSPVERPNQAGVVRAQPVVAGGVKPMGKPVAPKASALASTPPMPTSSTGQADAPIAKVLPKSTMADPMAKEVAAGGDIIARAQPMAMGMDSNVLSRAEPIARGLASATATAAGAAVSAAPRTQPAPRPAEDEFVPLSQRGNRYATVGTGEGKGSVEEFAPVNTLPSGRGLAYGETTVVSLKAGGDVPQVVSYDVSIYLALEGDSFESIAQTMYKKPGLGESLARFNGSRASATSTVPVGSRVRIPPMEVLGGASAGSSPSEGLSARLPASGEAAAAGREAFKRVEGSVPIESNVPKRGAFDPRVSEAANPPATKPGEYRTERTETWWAVSSKTLGDGRRWREIYDINRDRVQSESQVPAGTVLRLPKGKP